MNHWRSTVCRHNAVHRIDRVQREQDADEYTLSVAQDWTDGLQRISEKIKTSKSKKPNIMSKKERWLKDTKMFIETIRARKVKTIGQESKDFEKRFQHQENDNMDTNENK